MKRIIFVLIAVSISTISFAQKSQVVSAWNYLNNGELDKALTAINAASVEATTINLAKTWFYRGNIYLAIYSDTTRKDKSVNDLNEAYNSYKKAQELDTKGEYTLDMMNPWLTIAYYTFNEAVIPYNARDYQTAYDNFMKVSSIYQNVNATYKQAIIDTSASFYAANAAVKLKMYDEATKIYNSLINDKHFEDPEIYSNLADIVLASKDTTGAIAQLDKGIAKFPADQNLRIKQLNLYLFSHRFNEVIDKLKAAIEKEPKRGDLYQALGSAYENLIDNRKVEMGSTKEQIISTFGKPDNSTTTKVAGGGTTELLFYKNLSININDKGKVDYISDSRGDSDPNYLLAKQSYEKAIVLNPEDFTANYSLGALIYNRAVEKIKIMNNLPANDQKGYDSLKVVSNDLLKKSLPYLEKARNINRGDIETLNALKELYARLNMMDKLEEIKKGIDNLEVKIGMSKADVISILGTPNSVSKQTTSSGQTEMLFYKTVTVNIDENGKVDYINELK